MQRLFFRLHNWQFNYNFLQKCKIESNLNSMAKSGSHKKVAL